MVVLAAAALSHCKGALPTGARQPLFLPSRITVQEVSVEPATVAPGAAAVIRFKLVRGSDDGSPIYWTSYLLERPGGGGALSATSGGPVASGGAVEIVYRPTEKTTAFLTLYPSSSPGTPTGDGTGDWEALTIPVQ